LQSCSTAMSAGDSISRPKENEEPLDDFISMSPDNEISNVSATILKEPKEEPLGILNPYSSENEADDNAKEGMSQHGEASFALDSFGSETDHSFPNHLLDLIFTERRPSCRAPNNEKYWEKNELECPECNYGSRSVVAWESHLKVKHSTKPTLAGCLLRCDCGHESYSNTHSNHCKIANFTIIRKGDGTIRRTKMTPQCVLCKVHPKTTRGYAEHLYRHHKTSLTANGIFLKCGCGFHYIILNDYKKHDKKCDGRNFSLNKLGEE
ncbi:hypothetical protein PMAYCL1PPCAC_25271, partial [Pristionchus mayeri]